MHPIFVYFIFITDIISPINYSRNKNNYLLVNGLNICPYIQLIRGREERICLWVCVCVSFLPGFVSLPIISVFQAVFNLESLASGRKFYVQQITQRCSTGKLQYLILEFDAEQVT